MEEEVACASTMRETVLFLDNTSHASSGVAWTSGFLFATCSLTRRLALLETRVPSRELARWYNGMVNRPVVITPPSPRSHLHLDKTVLPVPNGCQERFAMTVNVTPIESSAPSGT
mmetsp:Transcript_93515/g.292500  ORF Transcript_93515/g.292500 Transcript_93515/m.292500 type:complete len:115 (-) Transcript_93515:1041-1385(-)